MRVLIAAAAVTLVGCSTTSSVRQITTPDGRKGFSVSCDGWGETSDLCYTKAREACGGDYEVMNRFEERTPQRGLVRRAEVACKA